MSDSNDVSGPELTEEPLPKARVYRRLLSNPKFRRLWISQFVSGVGDWLVIGFLIPLVTGLSGGSSFAVAGILIAKIIPALFLSSVTGVFVDRFDRRKLMMATDIARAGLALFLVTTNSLAVIYLVVLLMETASLFFIPAKNALIPYLVDEDDLAEANGLSYTTQQASMLIGLTASAAILAGFERIVRLVIDVNLIGVSRLVGLFAPALLGPRAGVILDSLTFLISAFAIWGIKISAKPATTEARRFDLSLVGKDVRESFVFLRDHEELRGLLTTIFLAILGGGALVTVGLEYIRKSLTQAALQPGVLERFAALRALVGAPQTFILVCLALGMVAGAIVVPRLMHRMRLQLLFAGSVAAFGVDMFLIALSSQYWQFAVLAMVAGACIAAVTVSGNTYVVLTTADEIRGRVFTALESVIRVALLLSMVVVAPVSGLIGNAVDSLAVASGISLLRVRLLPSRITLWLASAIVIGAAVYAFRTLSWRQPEGALPMSEGPQGQSIADRLGRAAPGVPLAVISLPPSREELAALRVGDEVLLSGPVYAARDATHERLLAALDESGELPFGLAGQVLFYAGPTPPSAGRPAGSVGPTTAGRMDAATPRLLAAGIAATIGKGGRSEAVREACAAYGAVYFAAVGGAAALLATHVTNSEPVAWPELGTEALVRMTLDGLPVFVAIDMLGNDLYSEAPRAWRAGGTAGGTAGEVQPS